MLRITLEQWRMFRAVAEYGGFNQASQNIHKSQSSIHSAVHKIEATLGVQLFRVQGRKTLLTDSGELMLRRANGLLDEAAKIEAVGQTLGEGIESRLSIAIDEIFPQNLLYKVLATTSAQFPLLNIELMEATLSGAKELLDNTHVDIALSPFTRQTGVSEQLCQIELMAVAHHQHSLHTLNKTLTVADLKSFRQIVVRDSGITKRRDDGWLGANQRWTVSHVQTSINMISNGLGYAWLPVGSITGELTSGVLKPLPLARGAKRTVQLYLIFNDSDTLGPAAQSFIHELRKAVKTE